MKKLAYLLPLCSLLCLTSCEKKDTPPPPPPPNPSAYYTADAESTLDTSSKKIQEPAPSHMKSGDQADSYADRPWLKKIRLALSEDKDLSPYAERINVIIIKGTIQLKGSVPNAQVRDELIKKIKLVVGDRKVEDELEVSE